jgi:Na+-transporting NADH:ubiquinone oxidoreductase subunit A
MIKLKKGLDLPIEGAPRQEISSGPNVSKVALIADDVVGMKPTMEVKVGDKVKIGQLLYSDKKTVGVKYTSPACGEVIEVNRGDKRVFQSVVIKVEGEDHVNFESYKGADVASYSSEDIEKFLIESGMWPSLRMRPFSKAATPGTRPRSLFVTAMDTNPLSADVQVVLKGQEAAFEKGLKVLHKLVGKVYLNTAPGANIPGKNIEGVVHNEFSGPHPAGLAGTHIHFLDPVSEKKFVWYTNYQEVVAIGKLFETGKLFLERTIAIAGPSARSPRLVKTRVGACLSELTKNESHETNNVRVVSGSVFGGRTAFGPFDYLGRFHHQVTLLKEGVERDFMGWHSPGFERFSVKPIYVSRFLNKTFGFNTNTNGSHRSIVPIGSFESVMPLDIQPTFLARYLASNNLEMCVKLGALELDEEDLSLMTFVDPCKNDYAPMLREKLNTIEKEG